MEQHSVFVGKCTDCKWYMALLAVHVIEANAEEHMMATGHTVIISEVN